jgi:hypothetical protein
MALVVGEIAESLVEGDELGVGGLGEGQEPAIANPLGGGSVGEWFSGLSEGGFRLLGVRTKLYPLIFKPAIIDSPSIPQGERLFAHDGVIGHEAKEAKLGKAGKDQP